MPYLGSAVAAVSPPVARSTAEAIIGFLVIAAVLIAYRQFVLKRQLERFEKPDPEQAHEQDDEAEDDDEGTASTEVDAGSDGEHEGREGDTGAGDAPRRR